MLPDQERPDRQLFTSEGRINIKNASTPRTSGFRFAQGVLYVPHQPRLPRHFSGRRDWRGLLNTLHNLNFYLDTRDGLGTP